jgi:hypothetical protein
MSDDSTVGPPEPAEPDERYLSLERQGHREVVRIPVSDWEKKPSVRGHLIKARFDNERQEWEMEVFTHDENGPLERAYCIVDWTNHFLVCDNVSCSGECVAKLLINPSG